MASWAYRSASFVSAGDASGDGLTVNKPTGTAAGDLIVYTVYWEGDSQSITLPSGFEWARTPDVNTEAGDDFLVGTAIKLAGSSEPSTYTFTPSVNGKWRIIGGSAYSGGTGTLTVDVTSGNTGDSQLDAAQTAPSVTTTGVRRLLIFSYGNINGGTNTGVTGAASNRRGTLGGLVQADAIVSTTGNGATGTTNPSGYGSVNYAAQHVAIVSDGPGTGVVTMSNAYGALRAAGGSFTNDITFTVPPNSTLLSVLWCADFSRSLSSAAWCYGEAFEQALTERHNANTGSDSVRFSWFDLINPTAGTYTLRLTGLQNDYQAFVHICTHQETDTTTPRGTIVVDEVASTTTPTASTHSTDNANQQVIGIGRGMSDIAISAGSANTVLMGDEARYAGSARVRLAYRQGTGAAIGLEFSSGSAQAWKIISARINAPAAASTWFPRRRCWWAAPLLRR